MIIQLIFGDTLIAFTLYSLMLVFFFYALGSIVQKYLSFREYNVLYSLPIGFVLYQLITLVFFLMPIFFGFSISWYSTMELFKEFALLFVIIYFYKLWIPNGLGINDGFMKKALFLGLTIVGALLVYFLLLEFVNIKRGSSQEFIDALSNLYDGSNNFFFIDNGSSSQTELMMRYQTFYYWIAVISRSFSEMDANVFTEYLLPTLIILISIMIIFATVVNSEEAIISYIIASILSFGVTSIYLFIGPYNQTFYLIPIITISILLIFNFSIQNEPSNKLLAASMATSLCFLGLTNWSFLLISVIGVASSIISFERKGQGVRNALWFLTMLFISVIIFSGLYFLQGEETTFSIAYLIVLPIILGLIIIPVNSLANSNNRRKDLASFEAKINKKIVISVSIFVAISTAFSLLIALITKINLYTEFDAFFSIWNLEWYYGFIIYLLIIVLPTIIILVLKQKYKLNYLINIFGYLALIFNPIILIVFSKILAETPSLFHIFIPMLIILILSLIELLIKWIPNSLKI